MISRRKMENSLSMQNPHPWEISWASGDVFSNQSLLSAVYGFTGGGGGVGVVFPIPQTLFILKAFKSPYFFKSPQIKFFNQGFPKEGVQRLEKIPNKSLTNLVKIFSVFF